MTFEEVLNTFGEFFVRENIRYAVVGGLAVQVWGASRFTKDVDIAVDRSASERVIAFAESLGFETLNVVEAFSSHLENATNTRVDILYLRRETADQVFGASTSHPVIGEAFAPVASPEHLAMMKALSMKNNPARAAYEGGDVRVLMNVPGFDFETVRNYYERLGLLGLFDAIEKTR